MVELQIISRVLKQGNLSLIQANGITEDYFITYSDEIRFIYEHASQYGNVPDRETFLAKFPNFTIVDVTETDRYLIDTFNEEHLYALTVPVINKVAEIIQSNSQEAVQYLQSQIPLLIKKGSVVGKDIISSANERYDEWMLKKSNPTKFSIPTGFPELDEITGGWQRGEEFVVIFARTGQGKTWVLLKSLEHAWKVGYRVGLIEPEMSPNKVGYRFDTLSANVSNTSLLRGKEIDDYQEYIQFLSKQTVPFIVSSPKDFNRKITVSKLRSFVESNNLDVLAIDGISYLKDERYQRGDNRTTGLTNVSEDLMDLSIELKIPVIVVAQSNREGANDDEAPDLENIRDSDGIAYNSSTVIAVKQKDPGIQLVSRKNRNGRSGDKLLYLWDPDIGKFQYIPSDESPQDNSEQIQHVKREYKDKSDVF